MSAATKHEPVKALSKLRVPRLHDLNHFGQRVKTEIVEIAKAAIPSSNQASGEFDCLLRRQACRATSPSLATLEGAAAAAAPQVLPDCIAASTARKAELMSPTWFSSPLPDLLQRAPSIDPPR